MNIVRAYGMPANPKRSILNPASGYPCFSGSSNEKQTSSYAKPFYLAFLLAIGGLLNSLPAVAKPLQVGNLMNIPKVSGPLAVQNEVVNHPTVKQKDIKVVSYPGSQPFQTYLFITFSMPPGYHLEPETPPDSESKNVIQGFGYRLDQNGEEVPFPLNVARYYTYHDALDPNLLVVGLYGPVTEKSEITIQPNKIKIRNEKNQEISYLEEQHIPIPPVPPYTTDALSATLYDNRPFIPLDFTPNSLKAFSSLAYEKAPAPTEPTGLVPVQQDLLVRTILTEAKPFLKHADQQADLLLKLYRVLQGDTVSVGAKAKKDPLAPYLTDEAIRGAVSDKQLAAALVCGSNLANYLPPPTPDEEVVPQPIASNTLLLALLQEIRTSFEKVEFAKFDANEQHLLVKRIAGHQGKGVLQLNARYRNESPLVLFPLLTYGLVCYEHQSDTSLEPKLTKQRAKVAWAVATLSYIYQVLSLQQTEKGQQLLQNLLKTNTVKAPTALVQLFDSLVFALSNSGGAPDLGPAFEDGPFSLLFREPVAFPDGVPYDNFEKFVENLPDVALLPSEGSGDPELSPLLRRLLSSVFVCPEIALPFHLSDQKAFVFLSNNNSLSNTQLIKVMKWLPIKGAQGFP